MIDAILVLILVVLLLALAGLVTWVNAPMFLKPRVRRPAVTANPGGPPPFPASGAAQDDWRTRGLPDATGRKPGACLPAIDPKTLAHLRRRMAGLPTRTDLPIPPPRNGVRMQDRPRQTVDVIICDPAVTPVVPRWYQAWLEGRWTP